MIVFIHWSNFRIQGKIFSPFMILNLLKTMDVHCLIEISFGHQMAPGIKYQRFSSKPRSMTAILECLVTESILLGEKIE